MRYLNLFFCVLLLSFVSMQYNDPDGLWWVVIYAMPTFWAGIAASRPRLLCRATTMTLLGICFFPIAVATIYYWPEIPHWWRREVWWHHETAREGIGLMIAFAAMLVVFLSSWLSGSPRTARDF